MNRNSHVINVGIIEDYTYSDDKYISIDIVFENGNHLYLTWINNFKIGGEGDFRITRIGNYAFGQYRISRNHENTRNQFHEGEGFNEGTGIYASLLERELNIRLKTIQNVIDNYNVLYNYISSLPYLDIDNNEHEKESINFNLYNPIINVTRNYFFTIYLFRIDWKDIYYDYHKPHERRPNY